MPKYLHDKLPDHYLDDNEVESRNAEEFLGAIAEMNETGDQQRVRSLMVGKQINLKHGITEKRKRNKKASFLENMSRRMCPQAPENDSDSVSDPEESKTVVRKLLDDAVNGHKLVEKELDEYVRAEGENPNCKDYYINIDFGGIIKEKENEQVMSCQVLYDILDFGVENEVIEHIIQHPVIAIFIMKKWEKTRKFYYMTTLIYFLFLLLFSMLIYELFGPKSRDDFHLDRADAPGGHNCADPLCTKENWNWPILIVCAVIYGILLVLLMVYEGMQLFILHRQYLKEMENYIEWFVFLVAMGTPFIKFLCETHTRYLFARNLAAVGVCTAWLQFIIIFGRMPLKGGNFSVMFFSVIQEIFSYVIAMVFMVFGFGLAFLVTHQCFPKNPFSSLFNPFRTVTMVLGEFEYADMEKRFDEAGDKVSYFFTMVLLLAMILFGTITMINLFVGVVVSDVNQLHNDVLKTVLTQMGQFCILAENLLPSFILEKMKIKMNVQICLHEMCKESECRAERLTDQYEPIREALKRKFVNTSDNAARQ